MGSHLYAGNIRHQMADNIKNRVRLNWVTSVPYLVLEHILNSQRFVHSLQFVFAEQGFAFKMIKNHSLAVPYPE